MHAYLQGYEAGRVYANMHVLVSLTQTHLCDPKMKGHHSDFTYKHPPKTLCSFSAAGVYLPFDAKNLVTALRLI